DGRIYVKGDPQKGISFREACLRGYQITGAYVNPNPDDLRDEKTGKTINTYACVATIVEVEVDTQTGKLDVLRITSAHDCGRAINPQIVENQIDMGLVQSNGYGRAEELIIDKDTGVILNPDLLDYKIMTILDMPKMDDIQEIIVEHPSAWGAFGSKGFSETGATSGAPAIANAVYNAIGGFISVTLVLATIFLDVRSTLASITQSYSVSEIFLTSLQPGIHKPNLSMSLKSSQVLCKGAFTMNFSSSMRLGFNVTSKGAWLIPF
ncbi:unnamed protein product, partial [marine sediment metagenome]